ncbi:PLAC8 family-domain-containing protein [Pyrenochaeta sp. MPI-SDFR-AT-0127]|nr:PLAC8 family-domain-containing protein [Pyrenochaeta sp. MPI-SDFR-AT-0127]
MSQYEKQDWHHSGAACCSPIGTCCLSWWCPCIVYGRTRHRTTNHGNMNGYSCCNYNCAAFCGLSCIGLHFILPMINRGDIRAKYQLKGNACTDCLCACCCGPCDVTQQDKETLYREQQRQPIFTQPEKAGMMNYQPQQQQPQFHHG